MTRSQLPSEDQVRQVAHDLLAIHRASGAYPTVTALAARVGLNRTTFYRHFPALAEEMLDAAQQQNKDSKKRRLPERSEDDTSRTLQRLRSDNENLRRHVQIYEEHIRKLTLQNAELREQAEQSAGVADLSERRADRSLPVWCVVSGHA